MKQVILTSCLAVSTLLSAAQMKEGRIIYERTMQLQIRLADSDNAPRDLPKERKDQYELLFANGQSLWRAIPDVNGDGGDMMFSNNGGAQIRIVMPGSNDILYNHFGQQRYVALRELGSKEFVVADSIRPYNWKLTAETREILGYPCKKAVAQRTQQSFRVNVENGVMNREAITDTLQIEAWFTDAIASFAGPDTYQGQLPGTILEINVNNGRNTFRAIEIIPKVNPKEIAEPKGKKITPAEFAMEREKMMKEMEANGGGTFETRVRN